MLSLKEQYKKRREEKKKKQALKEAEALKAKHRPPGS